MGEKTEVSTSGLGMPNRKSYEPTDGRMDGRTDGLTNLLPVADDVLQYFFRDDRVIPPLFQFDAVNAASLNKIKCTIANNY